MFISLVFSSKPIAINSHLFTDNPQVCIYNSNLSPGSQSFIFNCLPDFIFLDSKITEDGDCSHKIKRRLLLGKKARQCIKKKLDSVLKSRDITLLTKVHIIKAMVFPVVMYRCESWTIKKAECRRTEAFELWCWRRLLRVLWTARRSHQPTHWKRH